MARTVVVTRETEDNADSGSANYVMPFEGGLGYRFPSLTLVEGNFTEALRNLDDLQPALLSVQRDEWGPAEVKELSSFGQTGSGHSRRTIWDAVVENYISSFELAFIEHLRSGWIAYIFGQDDNTTDKGIWIVQSRENQTPSPKRPLHDALSVLELVAPTEKNDLEELLVLPLNWDSEGGLPATEDAVIEAARLIVEMYTKSQRKLEVTSLSAAIDGGVEFALEGLDGRELFIVIPSSGTEVRFVISLPTDSGGYEDTAGFLGSDRSLDSLTNDLVMLG